MTDSWEIIHYSQWGSRGGTAGRRVPGKRRVGVKLGAICWTNSRWAWAVLILMIDMLLSLEQRW